MATTHAHPVLQTTAVEHDHRNQSSPTMIDPDLLLPNRNLNISPNRLSGSSFLNSDTEPSPTSSTGVVSPGSSESFEFDTARAFLMPIRPKPAPPRRNPLMHSGYEHGAPLSDIGEEESSPRSKRARSRTPSPTASSPTIAPQITTRWSHKHEKRLSEISTCSSVSTGSDLHWEGFDTRAGMSDRLKADLATPTDDNFDLEGFGSRRNSTTANGDDEYTTQALSKRAEQILASAKKRLTVCLQLSHFILL
jgi:hypothetical protein